jgi:F-type H+-transporting ATPase subunit beta
LSRRLAGLGLYPSIDPLQSNSSLLTPKSVGQRHFSIASRTRTFLARYEELQDVIAILGVDELSEEDQIVVSRARRIQRFLTQPFFGSETYTGLEGKFVSLKDTLDGFEQILEGSFDQIPEQAFFMAGTISDVLEQSKQYNQDPQLVENR